MARSPGPRTILHIDMDAFFASIEQATNPALVGKPIAVVGSKKRTVIVTSSYEARKKGVKTGMTATEGKRACPDLILVPGNNRRYIDASVRILTILRDYSPDVEVFSIDEAFVDVTGSLRLFGGADAIAREIKRRIKEDLNITCSVGVAPNKLVAKLVSGLTKPDGLTIVTEAGGRPPHGDDADRGDLRDRLAAGKDPQGAGDRHLRRPRPLPRLGPQGEVRGRGGAAPLHGPGRGRDAPSSPSGRKTRQRASATP